MGYMTQYTLKVRNAADGSELTDTAPVLIAALRKRFEEAAYSLEEDGTESGGDCRWYEHQSDLCEFSRENPLFLFELHGEGEETGDIWTKYFLAGKCQVEKAKIQIAPFDRDKLV